ncbi:MAG: hypothetical protein ACR2FS_00990, partial [Phormidesmis sp.]
DLESVQYIETYHRLVNAAASRELVIAAQTPDIAHLQILVRESGVLNGCKLLQQLSVVKSSRPDPEPIVPPDGPDPADVEAAQKYILNLMATQSMMGMQALMNSAGEHVRSLSTEDLENIIDALCDANKIQMLDSTARLENKLLCWVPR